MFLPFYTLSIWINVMNVDGTLRRYPGWPNEILSNTLCRFNTDDFYPSCNGGSNPFRKYSDSAIATKQADGPECGKCQVVVSDPWFTYMKPKIHGVEMDTLERTNAKVFPTSRLSCCISLKPWMNEMIVRVVYDYNLHVEEETHEEGSMDSNIGGWSKSSYYPY